MLKKRQYQKTVTKQGEIYVALTGDQVAFTNVRIS